MKISLSSASACLLFMAWLGQVQLASIDYRYKRRGPPPIPRPPPIPQYHMKNWDNHHRPPRGSPPRHRPIPMQVMPDFIPPPPLSAPIGPPINLPVRPTPTPVRSYWKNTKSPFQVIPEKPFHSSPPISNSREFDYHVQTNSIPTHSFPIKQMDEKGPIHTIPAPNLSLADKPIVVEEVRKEIKIKPQKPILQQPRPHSIVQMHQYQVTEPNEVFIRNSPKQVFQREQQVRYSPEIYSNAQNYKEVQQVAINKLPPTDGYINIQGQLDDPRLTSNEIYQIINTQLQQQQVQQQQQQQQQQHQQQQQQHQQHQQQQVPEIYDNYEVPLLPQALVQQNPNQQLSFSEYQALIAQSHLLQGDPSYMQQIQHLFTHHHARDNNQIAFPTISQERQIQNYPSDEQSTFITTDYNFKAEAPDISPTVLQDPNRPESNLPYVQEVFNLSEENVASQNDIEQSIKVTEVKRKPSEENISSAFYTTLPNRQAAETLASLQAAGKMNNNNLNNYVQINQQRPQTTTINQRTPLEIYVPDTVDNQDIESQESDSESDDDNNNSNNNNESVSNKAEDNVKESNTSNKDSAQNSVTKYPTQTRNVFGNKVRPKTNQ